MPYIEALSRRSEVSHVYVFAPRLSYGSRLAMGWPTTWTTSGENLTVKIAPSDDYVTQKIREDERTVCLFSGITAFPEVEHWLRLSLAFPVKRGIITEAPFVYKKPLWLHKLRFILKDRKFVKDIDYVFAIGEDCEKYYKKRSVKWKVIPFMYCTTFPTDIEHLELVDSPMTVCFVGKLEPRKDTFYLLEALTHIKDNPPCVIIVGDGPEREMLEEIKDEEDLSTCEFVGAKPMEETQRIISESDVLVLPSAYDGWGAVINEAMCLGTYPVCSDRCGARKLITESGIGKVFKTKDSTQLAEILKTLASDIRNIRQRRSERVAWARQNISPEAVASRFCAGLQL